jgi:hypothetical protein
VDYRLRAAAGHLAPGRPRSHGGRKSSWRSGRSPEEFLTGAAASGDTKLTTEIGDILALRAAHGTGPLLAALERACVQSLVGRRSAHHPGTPRAHPKPRTPDSAPKFSTRGSGLDTGLDRGQGTRG